VGASDVHEHGKMLIDQVLAELGLDVIDGGTSVDPERPRRARNRGRRRCGCGQHL
jgi:methylmalonyl-CoA mutase cobalamin-binding subunit